MYRVVLWNSIQYMLTVPRLVLYNTVWESFGSFGSFSSFTFRNKYIVLVLIFGLNTPQAASYSFKY